MQYSQIQKLASAIKNDILGGLRGYHTNISISEEQLEDEIVEMRLQVLKEYSLKGVLPSKDLYISINCINSSDNLIKGICKTWAKIIT